MLNFPTQSLSVYLNGLLDFLRRLTANRHRCHGHGIVFIAAAMHGCVREAMVDKQKRLPMLGHQLQHVQQLVIVRLNAFDYVHVYQSKAKKRPRH
jgi:hypothetical protein